MKRVLAVAAALLAIGGVALAGSAVGSWSEAQDLEGERHDEASRVEDLTGQLERRQAANADMVPGAEEALAAAEAVDAAMAELD